MALSKFPVTSKNNMEYKVDVWFDQSTNWFVVEVYKEKKGMFGRSRFNKVWGGRLSGNYEPEEWNYDLVAMAKNEVQDYEKHIEEQLLHNQKLDKAADEFSNWDGKC